MEQWIILAIIRLLVATLLVADFVVGIGDVGSHDTSAFSISIDEPKSEEEK